MIRTSANLVLSKVALQALLAAISARPAAALWTTPNVHLFTNAVNPNSRTVLGDLTEATFAGYATVALPALAGPVHVQPDSEALLAEVNFIAGSVVSPGENIHGFFITDTTNAILYAAEAFDDPVSISASEDFLSILIQIPEPGLRTIE